MQWIKAHLNVVIAGTVSLLALVGLILGVLLPDVAAPLNEDAAVFSSLQSPSGAPRSALEKLRNEQLDHRKTLAEELRDYAERGNHKPLEVAAALFPKEDPSAQSAPFQFKQAFQEARKALLEMLNAQGPPTQAEIDAEADNIVRMHAQAQSEKSAVPEEPKPFANVLAPGAFNAGGYRPGASSSISGSGRQLPQLSPNPTPEERIQKVPEARAAVNKARRIWCYATLENLDQRPAITEAQRPQLDEMWYAQMSLWVQQDILSALHQLNESRASELPKKDQWVGNLPFKRLLAFQIGGYVPKADGGGSRRMGGPTSSNDGLSGPPPMNSSAVVTKHGCTETVDVVQFTLEMIVEAGALPAVIDQISRSGFYTVLQVGYEAEPPNVELVEYIYGSKPVIRAWLLVEGSFLRTNEEYAKLIPESVKEAIKEGRPVGGGAAGGAPGGASPGGMFRGGGFGTPSRGGRGAGMEVPPP